MAAGRLSVFEQPPAAPSEIRRLVGVDLGSPLGKSLGKQAIAASRGLAPPLPLLCGVKRPETRMSDGEPVAVDFAGERYMTTVMVPSSGIDLGAVERALIAFALDASDGNRTHAARFLGLSRSALIYRMHKHGLVTSGVREPR
jgi:hypothetical protein